MLDGDLGVIVVIAFPQATNWALALGEHLNVCSGARLLWINNCERVAHAFPFSELHDITLAQLVAQNQLGESVTSLNRLSSVCRCGGIGRRARLKIWYP